jgi:mono/diheme cytochrome c family protein
MKIQRTQNTCFPRLAVLLRLSPLFLSGVMLAAAQQPAAQPIAPRSDFLAWDADSKTFDAKPGELTARFIFYATNTSADTVVVTNLQRSCGCTEATMPAQPWSLAPGANGPIHATIDLRGKGGKITKLLTVQSTIGSKALSLNVEIPPSPNPNLNLTPNLNPPTNRPNMDRKSNQQAASLDRQAVFKGDCAACHSNPTVGKLGHELYQAGCAICHDAEHRAEMVPDLHTLKPATADYWTQWITASKPGSMMPAFAKSHDGPLSEHQIASLVDYLTHTLSKGS